MSLIRRVLYIVLIIVVASTKGFSQQDPITLNIGSGSGPQGSQVCVDLTIEDFIKVTSMQFVIRFDPSVIALDTPIIMTNPDLNIFSAFFNVDSLSVGYVNFIWFDGATSGVTLDDGDFVFTLCFELVGDPCDQSDIWIAESGAVAFEFIKIDCETGEDYDSTPIVNIGEITIDPAGFAISTAFCQSGDLTDSGSITFAGSGGNGPYSWSISGTSESGSGLEDCEEATVENLAPGTYTITFVDADNTVRNEIIVIEADSNFPFIVDVEGTNPTCFKADNGSIDVTNIEGGESPFSYEWSTFQFSEGMLEGLGSGDYILTVTDANGCTTSSEVSLNIDTLKVTFDIISDPSCDSMSNGIVSFFGEGGVPFPGGDYDFEVDGINPTIYFEDSPIPTNPFTPSNLPPGCFEVRISDNASTTCFSDPVEFCLEAGSFSNLAMDVTSVTCFGECDGDVEISAGILGTFIFQVTNPDGSALMSTNGNVPFGADQLCGGIYDVTVTDVGSGCSKDTFFTIIEPDLLELIVIDSLGPGCGGGDGMIAFAGLGGTEDYVFEWSDSFDQSSRMSMGGGNYSVTLTDANGCRDSVSFTFADGGDIGLNAFVCSAVSCGGVMDGSVCATVTSAGVFSFSWEDASGTNIGTGPQIDGLGGGVYFVTATDGMCTDTDTVFMAPGDTPEISIVQVDPTCSDSDDGTLTATLVSGTNPPMFEWSEPPSTAVLSAGAVLLDGVGLYNLNVVDENGCELDTLIVMLPPSNGIQVDITSIVSNICFGQCEGEATFTASGGPGGTGDYVFFISNISGSIDPNGNQTTITTLCGGDNWVYAIDGICASDTFFFSVPDADPILLNESASSLVPPSCAGGNDGSITIEVEGGNSSSFDILWVNEGIMGNALTDLPSGEYVYSVTDGSNCVFLDTIILEEPDSLKVSINPFTTVDIGCASGATGRIGLLVSGGNSGQLTYDWDPAVSNSDSAENLSPGIYSVTVTDSKGCSAETSYEMESADPVEFVLKPVEEPECFGEQTCIGVDTAFGGVGSKFTFTIVTGGLSFPLDTCINVFAGDYTIAVFDSTGCSVDTMITIGQPDEIIVDLGPDITVNLGESSDPISAFIVSELAIDSIVWDPITNLECNTVDCQIVTFSPLARTNYTVTVIDENGCLATDDINVFVNLARNVFFSNIFSPNGDNQNDFFQMATGSGVVEVSYFKLFDRWGNLVHQDVSYMPDDSLHPGWDGTKNGSEVETGVYVYFAEVLFADNVRVLYKGDVTLVR